MGKVANHFTKLSNHIESEYLRRGYSRSRAQYIGRAAAGKVAREKRAKH